LEKSQLLLDSDTRSGIANPGNAQESKSVGDALFGTHSYNLRVENRESLGHNVQKDHVIAQSKFSLMRQDPSGKMWHSNKDDLTVLVETGKATADRAALPHTIKSREDFADLGRLKAEGIRSVSSDIVQSSLDATARADYKNPRAVDTAINDQLARLWEQGAKSFSEEIALLGDADAPG
jgi:hypothetical protein